MDRRKGTWHGRCQRSLEQEGRLRLIRVKLLDCGEWKLWGRRPLTIEEGRRWLFRGNGVNVCTQPTSNHCEAADPVLKGLGGASQEDQQPALVFSSRVKESVGTRVPALFLFAQAKKIDRINRMDKIFEVVPTLVLSTM